MAQYLTRYGYSAEVNADNIEDIAAQLLHELRHEEYEETDDEHTQVSMANGQWSVTVDVSGLVTLDSLDVSDLANMPDSHYLRDIADQQLLAIWRAIILKDMDILRSFGWQSYEVLAPYQRDYYRLRQ